MQKLNARRRELIEALAILGWEVHVDSRGVMVVSDKRKYLGHEAAVKPWRNPIYGFSNLAGREDF
jgi:hypothetical protein